MRISTARSGLALLYSCNVRWIATAALTAASVDGKEMRNPSPRDLRTRPPKAMTLSCTISACDPRMSSAIRVAARSPQRGRADDVGHHDREHLGCGAAIRQGLPPC